MKALRTHEVGGPDTLTLDEVETPTPGKGQVLLPDVEESVVRLDLAPRRLYVRPPEGLFDDA